jgi:hypothetical protein
MKNNSIRFYSPFFVQCSSVKHNAHLTTLIPIDQLKSDVDFTYNEITKFTSTLLLSASQL